MAYAKERNCLTNKSGFTSSNYVFIKYLKHFRVVGREEDNVKGTGGVMRGEGEGE